MPLVPVPQLSRERLTVVKPRIMELAHGALHDVPRSAAEPPALPVHAPGLEPYHTIWLSQWGTHPKSVDSFWTQSWSSGTQLIFSWTAYELIILEMMIERLSDHCLMNISSYLSKYVSPLFLCFACARQHAPQALKFLPGLPKNFGTHSLRELSKSSMCVYPLHASLRSIILL